VIAYHLPPDATVGAVRPAKFVKYLRQMGWKPYVLTVGEKYAPLQDPTKVADLAQIPVVRTSVWPTVLEMAVKFKPRVGASGRTEPHSQGIGRAPRQNIAGRLKRYANSIFELPDKQIGWLIPAVFQARRMIKAEGIELVVTSSPPRTTALVGLVLSYLAPIRLVTDLRDPWFVPYGQEAWFTSLDQVAEGRSALGDRIERWLERKIMQRSARVIVTNDRLAAALRDAYPTLPEDRVCTISNGYDSDDLAGMARARQGSHKFTISYLGTLYLHRSPRSVFQALSELIRDGRVSRGDIEINLIGDVRSTIDGSVEDLIASYGLAGCIQIKAAVPYREALQQMMQSDLLLLFAPNQHCSIPGKAFEYLATRKPILCLAQDGATADLVKAADGGFVAEPEDVEGIKTALMTVIEAFKSGQPRINQGDISAYDRRNLSEQLSDVLMQIGRGAVVPSDDPYTAKVAARGLRL
jgi:glycosyltransferase involved in cell wall biosynthesis